MKKLFLLTIVIFTCAFGNSQETEQELTKYYFIRHAEKDRTDSNNKDPELTEIGLARADYWRDVLGNVEFDMVYSTNYKRTIQTAKPTADKNNLELLLYNPRDMYNEEFKKQTFGKNVLVVGHSNTTAKFANKVIGEETYPKIEDSNNSNLYIVTLAGDKIRHVLFKIDLPRK